MLHGVHFVIFRRQIYGNNATNQEQTPDIKELMDFYLRKGQLRNHLRVTFSIHTALRISDLLSLSWDDV